jgi:hypothetical protein
LTAGKGNQIASLKACLRDEAVQIASLTFWDDIAVLSSFRELISHGAFRGDTVKKEVAGEPEL